MIPPIFPRHASGSTSRSELRGNRRCRGRRTSYPAVWALQQPGSCYEPVEQRILTQIRTRKAACGSVSSVSFLRFVLYEHDEPYDSQILSELRAEVSLDVRARSFDEEDRTRSIRERISSQWWPTRSPEPLRAWLSPTAAACSACNGFLETHAEMVDPDEFQCTFGLID